MFQVPNIYRERNHPILKSDDSYGNNGAFTIPHYKIADYGFWCIASDGEGWEHVSVSLIKMIKKNVWKSVERCPTWEEMCFIKTKFWGPDDTVVQFHPPETEYVNNHPFCLHLWRPLEQIIQTPPSIMVGIKN